MVVGGSPDGGAVPGRDGTGLSQEHAQGEQRSKDSWVVSEDVGECAVFEHCECPSNAHEHQDFVWKMMNMA